MENELSCKIRQLRLEKNMTLEQVASVVGVGKSTVRKWETGMIANMKRDKIALLATALGTTPAFLMGWNEETEKTNAPREPELTEGEAALLELFRRVPEDSQQMVLDMIRAAVKMQG